MDQVLRGTDRFAGAYIDDIAISSETWRHLDHLDQVLQRPQRAKLTVNPAKCMSEVLYLGHKIGRGQQRSRNWWQ